MLNDIELSADEAETVVVINALAAGECLGDRGMGLEALELVVGRQVRIGIIEMDDEADGDEVVTVVIEERAAAGAVGERPAE